MIFNSLEFAIFLPVVFLLFWFVFSKNTRIQNIFIIVASYVFYGWWDWRFAILLAFITVCNYLSGIGIKRYPDKRLAILLSNVVINLGVLFYFKYFNFFVGSFVDAFSLLGKHLEISTLKIILPVGISFYTFQALGYSLDVYRKKIEPINDIISFFAYVSFFPQLAAGPIGRATALLPQFSQKRQFDYSLAVDGMGQILWGLFKKVVIADNCALCANYIFDKYDYLPGSTLAIGAVFYTIQIYCDFSGYSEIAIGTGQLFGIKLMQNFKYPYFSRDVAEFWRHWHISLTTWFRDYIYIPLGGSRVSKTKVVRNTFIIFLVSGFWHGANWTFITWGAYHALLFLPLILLGKNRKYTNTVAEGKLFPNFKEIFQMGITFGLVAMGWIFFRANSISEAFVCIGRIFSRTIISFPVGTGVNLIGNFILFLIPFMFAFEWLQRSEMHALRLTKVRSKVVRWSIYFFIIWLIFNYGGVQAPFIYFQF